MTDQELLQQCKDEVARDLQYSDWECLLDANPDDTYWKDTQYDRAAALAIQKAREEAGKPGKYKLWHPEFQEWIYWGFIDGMYVGPPTGRGLTLDYIQENSKLTDPGR